ncbi:Twinkle protein, mitochondrial [Lamellibrachia satsuma]|nr:Twinkle protein, mitochondrial [Lamellibrachia satsuma]
METNRSPDSFLHKRYGYHPGATVHHHGSSCWSGAHVCSRSSILGHSHGGGAPVRWCSSRASSNVIPLEQSKPVQTGEIKKFLADNEFVFREGYTCLISTCPRHVRRKIRLSELDRLYINRTTGYFVCQSCKKSGNWQQLQENMCNLLEIISHKKRKPSHCFDGMTLEDGMAEVRKAQELWQACIPVSALEQEKWDLLSYHLGIQGLNRELLERYQVRGTPDQDGLVLPAVSVQGSVVGVKSVILQTVKSGNTEKTRVVTRSSPRLDYHGLFGWGTMKSEDRELVLTANEFDAIAVSQATGLRAVALPKGDSVLPQQVLPMLEDFTKVTLWLGGAVKTWETAKQFSKKLNDSRCHLIRPGADQPNALAAIQQGLDLTKIMRSARLVRHKSIISFRSLRQDVYSELAMAEQIAGVKWKRYPQLNSLLKGHRRGELTVFTGPTGSGKTTFISDYSLDLCMQGVNTLWGSFEINNVRLLKTMLSQFSQMNLVKRLDTFEHWADQFEELPMYFMTFHGQENIRNVIETMSHAVYVQDIAHVVVDNLQFMMGLNTFSSTDRYIVQDKVISAFRKFATNMNCHVTLVIHPRKERDTDELTVASIFGSAKASQEADNILILQDKRLTSVRGRKYVQVAKNRFDGELGIMLLKFNKDTKSFSVSPSDGKKETPRRASGDGHH